jgi:hypothetical protein
VTPALWLLVAAGGAAAVGLVWAALRSGAVLPAAAAIAGGAAAVTGAATGQRVVALLALLADAIAAALQAIGHLTERLLSDDGES